MTNIFLQEVLEGLARPQKSLSPKWLYDDEGSHLFEDITKVEEYYPTRTEAEIFKTALPETAEIIGADSIVVEYGSGSGKKTVALLNHLAPKTYHPVDIAEDFLKSAAQDLQTQFPDIHIDPIVADFTDAAALPSLEETEVPNLGFFPGSTLGNLMPDEATSFLTGTRHSLGEKSYFLLGVDLVKDISILEAAYDDAKGVTAAFNLNLLTRINRELGADFNRQNFKHRAMFNSEASRIEMHLVSQTDQTIHISEQEFHFAEGETLHTESSYKYTIDGVKTLANQSGWVLHQTWTDPKDWFGIFLLKSV